MTTLSGTATLKDQVGGKGYFATVELQATMVEGNRFVTIDYSADLPMEWKEAVVVGIRHAVRHLPSKVMHNKQLSVTVKGVEWQPGDTTDIVMVFVASHAVFNMLSVLPPRIPEFLRGFDAFIFSR